MLKAPLQQIVALGEGLEHAIYLHTHVGWTEVLWTAVEKFRNLLLLNLYFHITLGTLFIWTIKMIKYRLLILSLSAMFSQCWTDRIDIDENKFFLSIDILSPKNNTLNLPLKSYLLIYWLSFQTLTSTAKSNVLTMQR